MGVVDDFNNGRNGGYGLVLYDGACVLCSGWFRFVARRDVQRKFLFTAIQSEYGRTFAVELGIDPNDPDSNAVLLDGKVHLYSDSALAVLSVLPGWRAARLFRIVPQALRDSVYRLIARHRYRICGRRAICDFGGSEYADRVLS